MASPRPKLRAWPACAHAANVGASTLNAARLTARSSMVARTAPVRDEDRCCARWLIGLALPRVMMSGALLGRCVPGVRAALAIVPAWAVAGEGDDRRQREDRRRADRG